MKININARVVVELTNAGVAQWVAHHEKFGRPDLFSPPYGKYETNLWELMQVFGAKMYMGAVDMMFVDNTIELIEIHNA